MWPQVVFIVLYHLKLIKDFHCTLNLWKTCQHVSSTGDSIQEALVQNLMEERSILKAKTQVKLGVRMCFFSLFLGWYMGLVLEYLGNKRTCQYQFHRWYHWYMGLLPERKYGKYSTCWSISWTWRILGGMPGFQMRPFDDILLETGYSPPTNHSITMFRLLIVFVAEKHGVVYHYWCPGWSKTI